jgi:hypothetical protein
MYPGRTIHLIGITLAVITLCCSFVCCCCCCVYFGCCCCGAQFRRSLCSVVLLVRCCLFGGVSFLNGVCQDLGSLPCSTVTTHNMGMITKSSTQSRSSCLVIHPSQCSPPCHHHTTYRDDTIVRPLNTPGIWAPYSCSAHTAAATGWHASVNKASGPPGLLGMSAWIDDLEYHGRLSVDELEEIMWCTYGPHKIVIIS